MDENARRRRDTLRERLGDFGRASSKAVGFGLALFVTASVATPAEASVGGVVYRAGTGEGVPGARVWLLYDESRLGEAPLPCDEDQSPVDLVTDSDVGATERRPLPRPVGEACLPDGQQGQTTQAGETEGVYRFDLPPSDPAMTYRLHVQPPVPGLTFPSVTRPARPGFAPPGPAAEGPVPDPGGPDAYWLRFRIAGTADDVIHNHVPLDALESLVTVRKSANRATISVGEQISYAVSVTNRSGEDVRVVAGGIGGGLVIRDLLPDGLRYVRGTTVASRLVVGPDGAVQRVCPRVGEAAVGCPSQRRGPAALAGTPEQPAIGGILDFGPYDLPAGESLEIRYTAVVAAGATVGEKVNRASALLDNVLLGEARAAVRVVPDPLFEQATLYGKVYCDENADGIQDPGDRGLPGVRVHADIGHHAVTDGAGKWHLQRIPPGMRLLKVDARTLPPGSRLLDPAAQTLYVTPGLDTTLSWRVACDLEPVAPATVDLLVPRSPDEVHLEGSTTGLGLTVGGDPAPIVRADVRLTTEAEPPDFRAAPPTAPDVAPMLDLYFHTRVTGPIARWRLVVARVPTEHGGRGPAMDQPRDWERVFATDGAGRPPGHLRIPEGASEFDRQTLHAYWLVVTGPDGVAARSPVRTFGVGFSEPPEEPVAIVIDSREGSDFVNGGAQPAAGLLEALRQVVEDLEDDPGRRVRVVAHVDASHGDAALPLSEARADAVRDWLVAEGVASLRIEARGVGSDEPLVPNIGARNQATNRRVEITVVPAPVPRVQVPALTFEPRAIVGRIGTVVPDESGAFRLRIDVPAEGRLIVGLRRADGATLGVALPMDEGGRLVSTEDLSDGERGVLAAFAREAAEGMIFEAERTPARRAPPADPATDAPGDPTVDTPGDPAVDTPGAGSPDDPSSDGTRLVDDPLAGRPPHAIQVHLSPGPAAPGHVRVEGHQAALPLLQLAAYADPTVLRPDEEGRWSGLIGFELEVPDVEVAVWRLEVGPAGEPREVAARGEGSPPRRITWEGPEGLIEEGAAWSHQLVIRDAADNLGRSAPGFIIAAGPAQIAVHHDLLEGEAVTPAGSEILEAFAEEVRGMGPGARVRIEAHTDPTGGAAAALERTVARAMAVSEALSAHGVAPGIIRSVGRGDQAPMVPNLSPRNRERNNRVVLVLEPPAPPAPRVIETVTSVNVAGVAARQDESGAWVARVDRIPDRLYVEITTADGREVRYRLVIPAEVIEAAEFSAGAGAGVGGWFGRRIAQGTVLGDDGDDTGTRLDDELPSLVPLVDPEEVELEEEPAEEEDDDAPESDPVEGRVPLHEAAGVERPAPETAFERRPIDEVDLSAVPAARTRVHLPPAGSIVRAPTLGIAGETAPGNQVSVNGEAVVVVGDGRFHAVVDLPRGASTVVVQVVDPQGNEAAVTREVMSEPDGLFILAMADTHAGPTGAELAGVTDRTRVGLGPVYLHGRGVGYARGDWRLEAGPFQDLSLTLHVDTAKEREASYFADLVAPDRHYPIYGDSADEVQDVAAAGPLYLSAKADANELRIGNFRTDPGVGGLFRYQRTFYGARLKLDHAFLDGAVRSRGEVFIADDPAGLRPAHVVMQGTGGSLYFLRHRDLVEGSERVRVVVRHRETGAELASRPLTRNVDYVVRRDAGQVLLMSPLPSVVESGWMAGMNLVSTLDGHPVFLVVDYEHLSAPGAGGVAGGGYLEETLFDWLRIGGGVMSQGGSAGVTPYQLWGVMAEARPMPSTFVRGEFARSRGRDVGGHYSADGGLSFAPLLPDCTGPAERSPICRDGGNAFKLDAGITLGDMMGTEEDGVRAAAHLHLQEYGFYGAQHLLDHGQRRIGGHLAWDVTEEDVLALRLDRVASDVPLGILGAGTGPTREVVRHYGGLRYQRTEDRFRAAGEWAFGRIRDPAREADEAILDTHILAAGGEYDATERLALVLEQDLVLGGDPRIFDAWNDRLTTTLGGRYRLTEALRLSLLGQVRWNGEHSALVGIQAKSGEQGNVYARQRFTRMAGGMGWRAQSVIGGEQVVGGGLRSYGEYQLDGGMSGHHGRAVLGLSNRWRPLEGVTLGVSYERVQILGDPGLGPVVPGATVDPLTGGISTTGRVDGQAPFHATGVNPAGAFYPGAMSRDAASASAELLRDPVKASARLELRHDTADERLAGTMPGVADRLQTVALANAAWTWNRDLAAIGRLNYAGTVNQTRQAEGLEAQEALWIEATAGVAYRPESHDFVNVLFKYTRLVDQRPLELTAGIGDRHASHVLSLAPVFRTPWRVTLSEKVAYKSTRIAGGLGLPEALRPPDATAHTMLWVNRLDVHVLPRFDLTGEYRMLWVGAEDADGTGLSATTKSGLVFEVAFRAADHLRLGVGWSFARFGDDELSRLDRDESGPFLRVTGTY